MTKVDLPYVRRKRGLLFWEPTPKMRKKGFDAKALGPETPESVAEAQRLYQAWQAVLAGSKRKLSYPAGSLGAYYERFTGKVGEAPHRWNKLKPRTREDYHRAWKHLGDRFGSRGLRDITVEDCERLADELETSLGPHERYRTIKVLRALYADAIPRLRLHGFEAPTKAIRNPQPRGRSAIWFGAEVATLIATAEATGYAGMAVAIRVAWDTLFSPVDVWSASWGSLKRDSEGAYIERARTKTDKGAFGYLSKATEEAIDAYVEKLGLTFPDDAQFIRQRNGSAYRSKDTFGDDFRAVRAVAFPGDTRQFQDLRRSGNVEADAAGADKATMAEIMANTMDKSRFLDETYTPPTVTKAREVARQRLAGRTKLAAELMRSKRSDSGS